jgi:hypothetical protein
MAGIVFYFENYDKDVWSGRKIDLDEWNYSCKVANINKAIIVNKSMYDVLSFDKDMDIEIVGELPSLSGHVTQLVTPHELKEGETAVSLWDFDHQTDWYFIGPSDGWVGNHFGDTLVTIPQHGIGYHHSVFIGSTVLFHRYGVLNS